MCGNVGKRLVIVFISALKAYPFLNMAKNPSTYSAVGLIRSAIASNF